MSKGLQIAVGAAIVVSLLGWYAYSNLQGEAAFQYYRNVDEFLANYYISSFWRTNRDRAWATYCKLPAGTTSDSVRRATTRLFGKRPDRRQFLRKLWQHQALLQVYHDFCLEDSSDCEQCPFPEQLLRW